MTATSPRRLSLLLVASIVAAACLAGCGGSNSSSSPPSSGSGEPGSDPAFQAARVIVVQVALDTKRVTASDIGLGTANNGIVGNSIQMNTWYNAGNTELYLVRGGSVTIGEEVPKVEGSLHHLSQFKTAEDRKNKIPTWTSEQAVRVILVQYLVDADAIAGTSIAGMTDGSGAVVAGPAVDSWFTAHQNDQLPGGGTMTLANEAALIMGPNGGLSVR